MTHEEAYNYIIKSYSNGKKRSFEDLLLFMAKFGNPQEKLRIVHVAGTNGKGSFCAMLSSILSESGYKTGMFTSPHLHRFNERFRINGEAISDEDFAAYMQIIKDVSEELFGDGILSYFQILTLMAFLYFYDKKVDFLVLETGIGGRLDSTNIITKPALSVIMSIDFDHMEYLGGTLEEITAEKCGIIKKNCPAVLYFQDSLVYNKVKEVCGSLNSELYYPNEMQAVVSKNDLSGLRFNISCEYFSYKDINLSLLGEYQINNTAAVLLAVSALRKYGASVSDESVIKGLAKTVWAGRMELMRPKGLPLVILEGAHNVEGTQMMAKSLKNYAAGKSVTLLTAILKGKEYEKMLDILTRASDGYKIILTKPIYSVRAIDPSVLYEAVDGCGITVITEQDYKRAVDLAFRLTPSDGIVCCTGSLYLVGDVRAYIAEKYLQ